MKRVLIFLALAFSCEAQEKWYDHYAREVDISRRIEAESGIFSHNYLQDRKPVPEALILKEFKEANRFNEDVRDSKILLNTGGVMYLAGLFALAWPLGWNLANRSDPAMKLEYKYWGYSGAALVGGGIVTLHFGDRILFDIVRRNNEALRPASTPKNPGPETP